MKLHICLRHTFNHYNTRCAILLFRLSVQHSLYLFFPVKLPNKIALLEVGECRHIFSFCHAGEVRHSVNIALLDSDTGTVQHIRLVR